MSIRYDLISMNPADGWRVAFLYLDDDNPLFIEPLIGWGMYAEVETGNACYSSRDHATGYRDVSGMVRSADYKYLASVGHDDDVKDEFWRYLAPGEDDPTSDEVAHEVAMRLWHIEHHQFGDALYESITGLEPIQPGHWSWSEEDVSSKQHDEFIVAIKKWVKKHPRPVAEVAQSG